MPFTLPNHWRVQAVFARNGADPVLNTFTFAKNATGTIQDIVQRLDTFYTGLATGQTSALRLYMTGAITGLTYRIRTADAAPGDPGSEIVSVPFTPTGVGNLLPPDAAVCSSYRGNPPYTGRRRGRIFLGPLKTIAMGADGKVAGGLRTDLAMATKGLASVSETNAVRWVIASGVANAATLIAEGYVDEHFDTQRRRDPGTEFFGRRPSTWTL